MKSYTKNGRLFLLLIATIAITNLTLLFIFLYPKDSSSAKSPNSFPELTKINKSSTFQELTDTFTAMAKRKGAEYSFSALKAAKLPPNTDTHLLAHAIGDVLYEQQGVEGITVCTSDFRNACSHTLVIGAFRKFGTAALDTISDVCKKAPGGKGAYTRCFHGLGHGVLAYANYDMGKAMKLCEKTGTDIYNKREYIECAGGVSMEMVNGVHDREQWEKQRPTYFHADKPLAPCSSDIVPGFVKHQCYYFLTPYLITLAGADFAWPEEEFFPKAFSYCKEIPAHDSKSLDRCYGGFGKEFTVLAQGRDIRHMDELSNENLQKVYTWCLMADDDLGTTACIQHASNSLYWGGENDYTKALTLCSISDAPYKENCYDNMLTNVSIYNDDAAYRQEFCSHIPKGSQEKCRMRLLNLQ